MIFLVNFAISCWFVLNVYVFTSMRMSMYIDYVNDKIKLLL